MDFPKHSETFWCNQYFMPFQLFKFWVATGQMHKLNGEECAAIVQKMSSSISATINRKRTRYYDKFFELIIHHKHLQL